MSKNEQFIQHSKNPDEDLVDPFNGDIDEDEFFENLMFYVFYAWLTGGRSSEAKRPE
jgi:hypothetical protein